MVRVRWVIVKMKVLAYAGRASFDGLRERSAGATGDPSLRLKNGYGQDDTILYGTILS
jgi:hypothetical protein